MSSAITPADCDLRDFPFVPLEPLRLFGSEFHARATDSEWRAGVTLWLKSFHQVPAASLPNDDVQLARLAELARDLKTWKRIKVVALHGWQECEDGRLYHPVVAEKALEAWVEKLRQRKSSAAGNAKRYKLDFRPEDFDHAIATAVGMLARLNPQSRVLRSRSAGSTPVEPPDGLPPGAPPGSQETGKGRQGKRSEEDSEPNGSGASAATNGFAGKPEWWPKQDRYGRIVSDLSDKIVFDVGKAVLGKSSGGQIKKLIQLYHDYRDVTDLLLQAEAKSNPGEWIAAVIRNRERDCFDELPALSREKYPEHAY